jgi:hypothetical protein
MKLFTVTLQYLLPLWYKYTPQHQAIKPLQSVEFFLLSHPVV